MSRSDEGGFDMVMEIAQQLLQEVAAEAPLPLNPTNGSFAGISGTFTPEVSIDSLTLGTFPQIILSIDLTGSTFVATSVPTFLQPVPQSLRNIDLSGDISVPVPLSVSGDALVADFSTAGAPTISSDLFDSLLAAPLIQFALAETLLIDPSGATYSSTLQQIKGAFATVIQQQIASLPDQTLIDFSGFSSSLQAATGTGLSGFTFSFGSESLFLLFTLGGSPGDPAAITRSNLLRTAEGEPADRADLVLSNACLLRDFLRPKLITLLGLSPGGFLPGFGIPPGSPIDWIGSAPVPQLVGGPIASAAITSLIAGDDGTNLRLLVSATATGILGSFTSTASIDITISVAMTVVGGTLTLTLTPVGTPVVNTTVSIPWWVYVFGFAIGGVEVATIIAAANAFGGNILNGFIAGALSSVGGFSFSAPLPAGTPPLNVRSLTMGQSDAPLQLVLLIGIPIPDPFFQNDIIVNFI